VDAVDHIRHNVLHGQWDWMRDPQIRSTTWEWDSASPAEQWKHSHNYVHHTWTNVLGKDRDIGYSALRVDPEQPWHLIYLTANLTRNIWSHTIIFCGHFPDGAEVFTQQQIEGETRGHWYLRQLLGSSNIDGRPLFHIMTGNLSHQIEHHLFPDLPSNRYAEIAPRVRDFCDRFALPYNTGTLTRRTISVWKRILRLSLPGPTPHNPQTATVSKTAPRTAVLMEVHHRRSGRPTHTTRPPRTNRIARRVIPDEITNLTTQAGVVRFRAESGIGGLAPQGTDLDDYRKCVHEGELRSALSYKAKVWLAQIQEHEPA